MAYININSLKNCIKNPGSNICPFSSTFNGFNYFPWDKPSLRCKQFCHSRWPTLGKFECPCIAVKHGKLGLEEVLAYGEKLLLETEKNGKLCDSIRNVYWTRVSQDTSD